MLKVVTALEVAVLAFLGFLAAELSAAGADLPNPRSHNPAIGCGRCGCLHMAYVYHRELESTYGLNFDPRDFDRTEPYFYLGRLRAYPRFWVDADPMQ
jgi:hypothetical protein